MEIHVQTKIDTQQPPNQSHFQMEAYIQIQKLIIQPINDYAQWAKILKCNLPEYAEKSREYTLTWWPKLGTLNPQNPEDLVKLRSLMHSIPSPPCLEYGREIITNRAHMHMMQDLTQCFQNNFQI
ncbi:unnamed protein product [Hymenolepis diminuta]|uniref:Uncharacterized protein n=1 Tax=Hymenolepis diminuta TaxID=6216 RepID=A0A564ZAG7_HYMDI|nr:unnamed protein product [Hymenolepis diminuta]